VRDQHCPWFNGCIGFGNFKPYFLFFFGVIGFLSESIFVTGSWLFLSFVGYEFEACHYGTSWNCYIIGFLTFAPLIPLGIAIFFLCWSGQLIFVNVTSQEFQQYYEMKRRNQQKRDEKNTNLDEYERWPYDLPDTNDNIRQFLGATNWIQPAAREAVNDGTVFTLNERWLAMYRNQSSIIEEEELV